MGKLLSKLLGWLFRPRPDRSPGFELEQEDLEALSTVVEVVVSIGSDHEPGRISFRGSTWPAVSVSEAIAEGELALLVHRDNLVWLVEPYYGIAKPGEKD